MHYVTVPPPVLLGARKRLNVFDRTVAGVLILGPVVAAVVLLVLGGTRN